jgi:hypothetical protein
MRRHRDLSPLAMHEVQNVFDLNAVRWILLGSSAYWICSLALADFSRDGGKLLCPEHI